MKGNAIRIAWIAGLSLLLSIVVYTRISTGSDNPDSARNPALPVIATAPAPARNAAVNLAEYVLLHKTRYENSGVRAEARGNMCPE